MGTEGKQYVWAIEHIFPQGENFPASWVQMIADGEAGLAKGHRETYAHCPGESHHIWLQQQQEFYGDAEPYRQSRP